MLKFIAPQVKMATILLVDENPLRSSLRQSILLRTFPNVVRVTDAAEALCWVESQKPSPNLRLVITTHSTVGIPASEFVAELRTRLESVPVLVLLPSAIDSTATLDSDYSGIDGVHPFVANSPDEFRKIVTRLLSGDKKQSA